MTEEIRGYFGTVTRTENENGATYIGPVIDLERMADERGYKVTKSQDVWKEYWAIDPDHKARMEVSGYLGIIVVLGDQYGKRDVVYATLSR